MGSPRLKGNTSELLKPFIAELEFNNAEFTYITLADKNILPCKGCYFCQDISNRCCIHLSNAYCNEWS